MATIYSPPSGFDAPDFADAMVDGRYDPATDDRLTAEYIERLATWCRERHQGDLVGEVVRFQIADGYAQYMIASHKPVTLIHLPIHDAWSIPDAHARGLRLSDLRSMVEADRRMRDLFAQRTT